ncbi:phosphotriesterase-related protein [Sporosarcina sp. FSL W7-1349]|uniref:phosphotriesterase family protein n=1 Tax=Sporosarcina sp. FSL W7-1349 TaxID=2921561 RepID=UPI0030F7CC11
MKINSVTGALDLDNLGYTLIHEHMRTRSEAVAVQFPHLYDEQEEFELAVRQVAEAKRFGVKTIFDPTVMGLDRDVQLMKRISRETGVQIIPATGVYTFNFLPSRFAVNSIAFLADQFIRDIEVGIQNTGIKAGFLKCAADAQGITPDVEKVIRAVARAHLQTGLPIMTHSHPATETGLRQVEIFKEEGVNMGRVLIGHCGDTDNLEYIEKVLDYGVFIGMDRYGLTKALSTEKRNETVKKLADKGYADRMFLSQDYCCTTDMYKPNHLKKEAYPDWSMTFLLREVIPTLLEQGITDEQIQIMMVENVKSWFSK